MIVSRYFIHVETEPQINLRNSLSSYMRKMFLNSLSEIGQHVLGCRLIWQLHHLIEILFSNLDKILRHVVPDDERMVEFFHNFLIYNLF